MGEKDVLCGTVQYSARFQGRRRPLVYLPHTLATKPPMSYTVSPCNLCNVCCH